LKHGVCALQAPVDNLVSNWASPFPVVGLSLR
jgi:hypothetical protein